MSYVYRVLYDIPYGFWPLNGSFTDASGQGNTATSGTLNWTSSADRPIVARGINSLHIGSTETLTLPVVGLGAQNYHTTSFTYEIWFKSRSATGTGNLIARTVGGIFVSGDTITFTVPLSTPLSVTWNGVVVGENYHVVGIYDTQGIRLYVNGLLVGTADVDQTILLSGFTDTAALTSSAGTGYSMAVDGIAVYNYPLNDPTIAAHYAYGTDQNTVRDTSAALDANIFELVDNRASLNYEYILDETSEWASGVFTGQVTTVDNALQNFWTNTGSQYGSGTYITSFDVPAQAITTVGSRISWVANKYASGYTVDVSTDGTSWTTVTNGSQPFGATNLAAGVTFWVRVTFATSTTVTSLSKLRVAIYTNKNIMSSSNSGVSLTLNNAINVSISDAAYNPALFSDNMGMNLPGTTSRVTIPQDTVFGGYQAVEFYAKWASNTVSATILYTAEGATVATNASGQWTWSGGASVYVDGVLLTGTPTPQAGRWHHIVVLIPTTTAGINIGNSAANTVGFPMQIGFISAFFPTLTATQITSLYNAVVGYIPSRLIDTSVIGVAEYTYSQTSTAYRPYQYDWSVGGSA